MILTESKIIVNGLELNYVEAGTGQPIIFMHNGGGFWHSWEHQLKHFSSSHRVFGIDWPGFGESEAPKGRITLELLTDTLKSFIESKELTEVILVGNCIGGSVALNYTLKSPETVSKLVIFNICPGDLVVRFPFMRRFLNRLNDRPRAKRCMEKLLTFSTQKTPIKHQFPKILFKNQPDRSSALFLHYEAKFKEERQMQSRLKLLFAASSYNLNRFVKDQTIPEHLLVWGAENNVTPLETHGEFHRNQLRSSEFAVIENAGHLCMYEAPERTIQLIEAYLRT